MDLDHEFVTHHFGEMMDFGPCVVGQNLNVLTVRGFGRLDQLAVISAPDVYDMVDNPEGTQRDLKEKHAQQCLEYALEAAALPPEESPRFFPEVLLNARDANPVELYRLDDPNELIDLSSFSDPDEVEHRAIGLRIRLSAIEYPKITKDPQISRVDGNHRLHGTDEVLEAAASAGDEEVDEDFPSIAFAMLLDLSNQQEAGLFRDINAEHEGMEVAHLTALTGRIHEGELKTEQKLRPLWLALELAKPGRAFENKVFMGGAKTGVKKATGGVPPVKINALKTTVAQQLKSAPTVAKNLEDDPDGMLELLDNFWKAVGQKFPAAWNNKRDYILLQAIGLGAFARFGGVVLERAYEAETVTETDFERELAPVSKTKLDRNEYPGIAGAGGIQFIFDRLLEHDNEDETKAERIKAKLKQPQASPLDALEGDDAKSAEEGGDGEEVDKGVAVSEPREES
jgi:DGQHR domain-containing protein